MSTNESLPTQFHGRLDCPAVGEHVHGQLEIAGWVLTQPDVPLQLEVTLDGQPVPGTLPWCPRPPVAAAHPRLAEDNPTPGFVVSDIDVTPYGCGRRVLTVTARGDGQAVVLGAVEVELVAAVLDYTLDAPVD